MSTKLKDVTDREEKESQLTLTEIAQKLVKERNKVLDDFAKAYLAETKIMPSDLELVVREERTKDVIETIYYFRKKNDEKA